VKPVLTTGPDGHYLSLRTEEDGKKFWSINLEEASMAEMANAMQGLVTENANGKAQARLRVMCVKNVFGLNQVFDVVMNKQTMERCGSSRAVAHGRRRRRLVGRASAGWRPCQAAAWQRRTSRPCWRP